MLGIASAALGTSPGLHRPAIPITPGWAGQVRHAMTTRCQLHRCIQIKFRVGKKAMQMCAQVKQAITGCEEHAVISIRSIQDRIEERVTVSPRIPLTPGTNSSTPSPLAGATEPCTQKHPDNSPTSTFTGSPFTHQNHSIPVAATACVCMLSLSYFCQNNPAGQQRQEALTHKLAQTQQMGHWDEPVLG